MTMNTPTAPVHPNLGPNTAANAVDRVSDRPTMTVGVRPK